MPSSKETRIKIRFRFKKHRSTNDKAMCEVMMIDRKKTKNLIAMLSLKGQWPRQVEHSGGVDASAEGTVRKCF